MVETVTIIDLADKIIDAKPRTEVKKQGYTYRVTYTLVFNSTGEILVQKRTDTKDWCPGRLDLAAGGIVQYDENYQLSAERELMEELGVAPPLTRRFKVFYDDITAPIKNRNWGMVYSCVHNGPFELQADEVASTEFMPVADAFALDPVIVTPDTRQVLIAYLL
jgi:8-oxo-dGTP pyrophosphatase MutT (NUDIX family)